MPHVEVGSRPSERPFCPCGRNRLPNKGIRKRKGRPMVRLGARCRLCKAESR